MRPIVWVSPTAIIWVAVDGSIRYSTKVANGTSLWVILSLRVKAHPRSDPILGLSRGLQYPYYLGANQADVFLIALTFRSIWELIWGCVMRLRVGITF